MLKVFAELARSGMPVRLWDRPINMCVPERLRAIERLKDPSHDEFWRYVATNTPCVVTDAFKDMSCMTTFRDDEHLKQLCGHREARRSRVARSRARAAGAARRRACLPRRCW